MATRMDGSFTVPADRWTVWRLLNDPGVLQACITGCETVEKLDDTHFIATARVKLGPLRVTIKGRITLENIDAPNGCRLIGEGQGGIAGFAGGFADISLTEGPGGTIVTYGVEAQLGGRLAHFGGRFVDGVAQRKADGFFRAFVGVLAARKVTTP